MAIDLRPCVLADAIAIWPPYGGGRSARKPGGWTSHSGPASAVR